jgi:hypothetical protein
MAINITSLFQDILESPEQKQQRQMAEGFARSQNAVSQLTGMARAAAPLVGTMAELQPQRNEMLQRGVGRLLGRDVRSTSEKLQEALSQFNPQDPASVSQTTQMLQSMGLGAQGAQLAAMALEEQQRKAAVDLQTKGARQTIDMNQASIDAEDARKAQVESNRPRLLSIVESSTASEPKKEALGIAVNSGAFDADPQALIDAAFPDDKDRYKVVGQGVFDTASSSFITDANAPAASANEVLATIDPDQYDIASQSAFRLAYNAATTQQERDLAVLQLQEKPETGKRWVSAFNDQNEPIFTQAPIPGTDAFIEMRKEVEAANATANRVIDNSSNTVAVLDKLINSLESAPEDSEFVETGITGIVLSLVPGTGEADFAADQETLYSNMGIGELESMRAASANGASGFGQLTAPELNLLKARIRNISVRQSRQQQVDNLKFLRDRFAGMANSAKTDWTMDEWIGAAPRTGAQQRTQAPAATGTTSGGATFSYTPVGAQ